MNASEIFHFLLNLVSALIVAILPPIILRSLPGKESRPHVAKKPRPRFVLSHWILGMGAGVLVFVLLSFFVNPSPAIYLGAIKESPPTLMEDGRTEYVFEVTGYVKHWNGNVYLVVKPSNSGHWFVQSPVDFMGSGNEETRNWAGQGHFYTARRGTGEEFKIFALATRSSYQPDAELAIQPDGYKSNVNTIWGSTQ